MLPKPAFSGLAAQYRAGHGPHVFVHNRRHADSKVDSSTIIGAHYGARITCRCRLGMRRSFVREPHKRVPSGLHRRSIQSVGFRIAQPIRAQELSAIHG